MTTADDSVVVDLHGHPDTAVSGITLRHDGISTLKVLVEVHEPKTTLRPVTG